MNMPSTEATNTPADPGDTRFENVLLENEDTPYGLRSIDDQGEEVGFDFFATQWERSSYVAEFREHQDLLDEADRLGVHPLEIALAPFGPEWQREQEERYGWAS